MKTKISNIDTKVCGDQAVEFKIQVQGPINRARVEYGDGKNEDLTLPPDTMSPVLYCEHLFKPGRYKVLFVVYDGSNKLLDRTVVSWGQN